MSQTDDGVIHKDSNGAVLSAGDTVTLNKGSGCKGNQLYRQARNSSAQYFTGAEQP